MASLEALLIDNYDELISDECKQKVIEFVEKKPTVEHFDLNFIKRLTKVAFHVYTSDPELLEKHLGRIYTFNMEGVMKAKSRPKGYAPQNLLILESHMSRYAGNLATRILEKTGDPKWGAKAYSCLINSYKISLKLNSDAEKRYAAKSAEEAAIASSMMFEVTKDLSWAKKMYKSNYNSANLFFETEDPMRAANRFADSGKAANVLFKATEKMECAENWFDNRKLAAELLMESNPKSSALYFGSAGKAAEKLYLLTNRLKWAKECYDNRFKSAELWTQFEAPDAPYLFELAGNAAKIVFEKMSDSNIDKIQWAEKWYGSHGTAADIFDQDPKKNAYLLASASEAAGYVFENSKDLVWAQKSYIAGILAGEIILEDNPSFAYNIYELIVNVAETAFDISQSPFWGEKAFEGYTQIVSMTKDSKPEVYPKLLSNAASLSKKVFDITMDPEWAQRCYDDNLELAAMIAVIGPLSSAEAYKTSGSVAKKIGAEMRNTTWLSNAITCFRKAQSFFDSRDPNTQEIHEEILDSATHLQSAIKGN